MLAKSCSGDGLRFSDAQLQGRKEGELDENFKKIMLGEKELLKHLK